VGRASLVIDAYGFRRFIADIDRDREYWRDSSSIVSACLDWAAGEGFEEFFGRFPEWQWTTAHEFRQRHLVRAISRMRRG
jgi:hypothetical protein